MKVAFFGFALTFAVAVTAYPPSSVVFGYEPFESATDAIKLAQTDENDAAAPTQTKPLTSPRQLKLPASTKCYAEDLVGACSGTTECREFEQRPDGDLIPKTCVARPFCEQSIAPCE
jgi:hypothetical protein